ncbi:hypothetical protein B7693_04540 [Streptococcus mitis]|uniref:Uncharacterized protein n=1 Tax=Streptococcus mitis TaxID=28037 RepID=A0A1X1KTT2_STRMT|nr:hypothetical protein [Streptococcus mitis]ORP02790.1 hypothetical protein B7693_04540 [Streptococcus mitis]
MDQSFDQLVTEALAKRLSEAELRCAQLEALYTLTAKELQEINDVLAYDPALKELFEEVKGKMTNGN